MCSSRLALDQANRLIVVATTTDQVTQLGQVFLVLNVFRLGWFEPRGRRPTAREQATARPPYESSPRRWNKPADVPDEELSDQAALEAAYREQTREPVDLIGVAA